AESMTPWQNGYAAADAALAMKWMHAVLLNRRRYRPGLFNAPDPATLRDIVTAPNQIAGFSRYPDIEPSVQRNINDIVANANDDELPRRREFEVHIQKAIDATRAEDILDPSRGGLFGWRTAGHGA